MREIKFMAWHKEKKILREVLEISFSGGYVILAGFGSFGEIEAPIRDVELMQYTGLKDKNDKEIYEGDILTWGNNVIAKVYYADDLAMFRCVIEGTDEFDLFAFNQEASIIGNIYENKELLDE